MAQAEAEKTMNGWRAFGEEAKVNWNTTASDYATHRQGFPKAFFDRTARFLVESRKWDSISGKKLLDLGTGTGTVARGFALMGAEVTALDPHTEMVAQAKALDKQSGIEGKITYVAGKAEQTGLPASAFDLVTAGQCWHWFDSRAALTEVARLLRPDGQLVIAHFDWLPIKGSVAHASEQLILKHNPKWTLHSGVGVYPLWTIHAAETGYTDIETFTFDVDAIYTHEAWRGRIRACSGVAASLSPEQTKEFDKEHTALLQQRFPSDPLHVLHRVFVMLATRQNRDT